MFGNPGASTLDALYWTFLLFRFPRFCAFLFFLPFFPPLIRLPLNRFWFPADRSTVQPGDR